MRTPATSRPTALRRPAVRLAAVRRVLVAEHARHPDEQLAEPRSGRSPGARDPRAGRPAPALAAVRSALAGRPRTPRGAR